MTLLQVHWFQKVLRTTFHFWISCFLWLETLFQPISAPCNTNWCPHVLHWILNHNFISCSTLSLATSIESIYCLGHFILGLFFPSCCSSNKLVYEVFSPRTKSFGQIGQCLIPTPKLWCIQGPFDAYFYVKNHMNWPLICSQFSTEWPRELFRVMIPFMNISGQQKVKVMCFMLIN